VVGVLKRVWVLLQSTCGNILEGGGIKFHNFVKFEVGAGSHVSFWHKLWCGNKSLKLCFLVLFSIARHKDARVGDNLVVQKGIT
jgi:hypothetical protein